jgi:predicted dehydrogenase
MILKAGICGVGSFYSTAFASTAKSHPSVRLVACAHLDQPDEELKRLRRPTKGDFAAQFGLNAYRDVDEMVRTESLDLVFVCAPDNVKATQVVRAVEAGAHVYISKPMCKDLAGADAMLATARRANKLVSPLIPGRYDGAIRTMMGRVIGGEIGRVVSARAWIQHGCFGPGTVFDGSPEFGPEQGGIDLSLGFYAADLLLWAIQAKPVRAYAEYDNLASPHSIWLDTGKATVRFEDGRMGSADIIFNVSCGAPAWEMEVVGTDGIARAHLDVQEGILWHKDSPSAPRTFYRNQNDVIGSAVDRFVRSLTRGEPLDITLEQGRNVLELCLAWTESSRAHQPVTLPLPA